MVSGIASVERIHLEESRNGWLLNAISEVERWPKAIMFSRTQRTELTKR